MLIVTYNIQWGKGRDGRIDLARIADTVGGADVIALQEVERHWRPQDFPDQVLRLAELLPSHHWVYGPSLDLDGSMGQPGGRVVNRRRQCGNMILSRYPISSTRTLPLPAWPVSGHMNDQAALLEAVIAAPEPLRVYNVHLNYLSRRQRLAQIARMMDFIAEAPAQGGPVTMPNKAAQGAEDEWIVLTDARLPEFPRPALLMGDFNAGPGTPEYAAVAGEHSEIYGRLTEGDRFADALTLAGLPESEGVTFPGGSEPPQRLDHCFLSIDLVPRFRRAWIDGEAAGSDHQPVWAEIA